MALRAVTDHPKFFRLKLLLKLNKSCTLGYLEALWHFCGKYTPQGNLGKYSDAEIEAWLEWDGAAGDLIGCLTNAGWIDLSAEHRLLIHDWHQHADDAAKKAVRRSGKELIGKVAFVVPTEDGHGEDKSRLPVPEPEPEPESGKVPLPIDPDPEIALPERPAIAGMNLVEADVERVYAAYPRKVGKGKALAEIRSAVLHLATGADWPVLTAMDALSMLHEKATRFARSPAGNAGDYTPHPATWFHQKRYLDDEKEWQRGSNQGITSANRGQARVDGALAALSRANAADTDS